MAVGASTMAIVAGTGAGAVGMISPSAVLKPASRDILQLIIGHVKGVTSIACCYNSFLQTTAGLVVFTCWQQETVTHTVYA